jgi:hypothetical protein
LNSFDKNDKFLNAFLQQPFKILHTFTAAFRGRTFRLSAQWKNCREEDKICKTLKTIFIMNKTDFQKRVYVSPAWETVSIKLSHSIAQVSGGYDGFYNDGTGQEKKVW